MSKIDTKTETEREFNVVLALEMREPMSLDVLDANSDDVLEAVQKHASEIALGPTVSLAMRNHAILLRFDAIAPTEAEVYRKVADVLATLETHTDLRFVRSRSDVEANPPAHESEQVVAC